MSASAEASSMKSTNFLANMSTFIFIFFMIIFGVIALFLLAFLCKDTIKTMIMKKLTDFKDKTFFENSIKA